MANEPPSPEADFDSVVVRVFTDPSQPRWTVNGSPVESLGELRQILISIARIKRDAPLILDPAGEVPLGNVIDVFDLARLTGFEKIQFAASVTAE